MKHDKHEHMAHRKSQGVTYKEMAKEFGTSKSSAHRSVKKHEARGVSATAKKGRED
jgi:transposase